MITRPITRPVTSPIARAVNDAIGAWNPRALFALGEQGVIYDPSDLSTLWQDSAGTTPVTAAGQPVGLMLDKRLGLVRGAEILTNGDFSQGAAGWTISGADATHIATFSGGTLRYQSGTTSPQLTVAASAGVATIGKAYEVTVVVSAHVSGGVKVFENTTGSVAIAGVGTFKGVIVASSAVLSITRTTANVDITIGSVSLRELHGNHAVQPTASAKPFIRDTPRRIDYDADDSLAVTFQAALGSACTVARSIPGVGAQILTAQTIGTSFTDNVDNCGLIIVNRALNAAETANLTRYLNQRAGV
ncbi:hypothetical protein SAMN05216229_1234 [Geopseudomonas sagittaria]|uniref:Uncharacterized protein n=1 Tax=Geopseudomonas sagittaria TaxID=1135990 RepID=A0A1I5YN18_9GAMM|nr:hypothetical protein [Pseudomonas sagittaria]SFQ45651.1 hypothetical protein SAMN05216229_1234 [Pseudomonas sagittaria]